MIIGSVLFGQSTPGDVRPRPAGLLGVAGCLCAGLVCPAAAQPREHAHRSVENHPKKKSESRVSPHFVFFFGWGGKKLNEATGRFGWRSRFAWLGHQLRGFRSTNHLWSSLVRIIAMGAMG